MKKSKRRRELKPCELIVRFTAWIAAQLDGWRSRVWIHRRRVRGRNWSVSKYTLDSGLSAKCFRWMFWCCASADRWGCINENWMFHDINPIHWTVNTVEAPHHTRSFYSGKEERNILPWLYFLSYNLWLWILPLKNLRVNRPLESIILKRG